MPHAYIHLVGARSHTSTVHEQPGNSYPCMLLLAARSYSL
ncbi:hypothetical protein RSOL_134520 [Rhizoctonia solani AG-3 Rhs1AP]|uniref:Uncharacterized protein n=1 Tax=Rhizoctonia solani AG-3 Rhs1AP TaxID=1086054 RepID=X8J074_9AGAM|nr:hypothetical protein RSOL_134520 [Rhizoctonia solani AG-3 Rhs1AP]